MLRKSSISLAQALSVGGSPATLPCLWSLGVTFLKHSLWTGTGHSSLQMGSLHCVKKVLNKQTICVQLNKIKLYLLVKFYYLQSTIF